MRVIRDQIDWRDTRHMSEMEMERLHAQTLPELFRAAMFQTRSKRLRQRGTKADSDSELGCIVSAHESVAPCR